MHQKTKAVLLAKFWFSVHVISMAAIWAGIVLTWYMPLLLPIQLGGLVWLLWFHKKNGYCPLTKLEKEQLEHAGQEVYENGFYAHYLFLKIFGQTVSDGFVRKFLIYTKVVPGFIPALYPLLWLIFD